MSGCISIVLVGIGGYGNNYVSELLDHPDQQAISIVGAVEPSPTSCNRLAELQARGVVIYASLESFYSANTADLAIISSPPQFHASQMCEALEHGSNVLCEKPLCATPDEAKRVALAQKKSGKLTAIGYQWSFSRAIQEFKSDILAGVLGKPIRLRTLVLWPRDDRYYSRNSWAGAIQSRQGAWVLDSPVNNACAHYFHNMLYVLGNAVNRAAVPISITAELNRAYSIQSYDTAAIRCITSENVELLFFTTHLISERVGPNFIYEFERGTVSFIDSPTEDLTVRFPDGSIKNYGPPHAERMRKLWSTIEAIRTGADSVCGVSAATAHTRCVWAIQQSSPEITVFAPESVHARRVSEGQQLIVDGLAEAMTVCYEQGRLPSEIGYRWARPGKTVTVAD